MSRVPVVPFVVVLLSLFLSAVRADDQGCYTSGSVAGIVIATIVVTLVMGGLAAAFIWYLWKQRKGVCADGKSVEKPISCPPMSPDKQLIVRESNDYAFDNPYFKDDETDNTTPDAAEKGEAGFHVDNGDITPAQNAKASNGTTGQQKKNRPFSSLPFHAVFHPSGKKQRATMDDTYISKHLERVTVPLRGHDFTGLGFNICGNMRDGIFVKDVLHRGPASESGKIKAGDRIVGVTVSFGAMVYEDALTILSYASPYDVKLEIEKSPVTSSVAGIPHLPSSSPKRLGASTSFRSNGQRRLFHPLYRSQSIDDLTQIGKDSFLGGNTSGSQKDSSSSATPKRSQSVEATNGGQKARSAYSLKAADEPASKSLSSNKGSRKSSTSSCESVGKVTVNTAASEKQSTPKVEAVRKESKSSRFRVEQINVKTEAPTVQHQQVPPPKPARDTADEKQIQESNKNSTTHAFVSEPEKVEMPSNEAPTEATTVLPEEHTPNGVEMEVDAEKPTAPPRKASTPAKRRAPAPPATAPVKSETSTVVVHRVDDQPSYTTEPAEPEAAQESDLPEPSPPQPPPPPPPTTELPDFSSEEKIPEVDLGSSDNSSLASGGHCSQKDVKEEPSSPGKRKASSLGDLTKLDHNSKKKDSTSSAILERAVSLDLQQSLPGGNLVKQKKILRAPTFENDYDEDREGDLSEVDGPGLKRWDDGLGKVFVGLTNGDTKPDDDLRKEETTAFSSTPDFTTEVMTGLLTENNAKEKNSPAVDLDFDSSSGEIPLPNSEETETQVTSTPVKKVIEVKNLFKDDDDTLDDIPYLASAKQQNHEESSTKHSTKISSSSIPLCSPVTISIPVIKPDLTHFEKLPSPPPASTHPALDPSWRVTKITTSEDTNRSPLERISVQSLYRPIFSNKEVPSGEPSPDTSMEKLVNGNESDSSEHYSTAQENITASSVGNNSTSTLSVPLSPTVANNVTVKTPSNVAGFAKTLIIPGPNEVESLLSLATEPNTPPPNLEPPPKPVESE